MTLLAQFLVTFFLGFIAARSVHFWSRYAIYIFGILAVPTLAVIFMAGDESALWDVLGAGLGLLLAGLLASLAALFQNLPVMTAGMFIGALIGGGLLR